MCAINDIEMSTTRWPSLTLASQSRPGPLLQMSNVTSSSTGHKVVHAGKIRRFEEEERVWGGGWGGSLLTRPPLFLMWWCNCVFVQKT